MLSQLKRFSAKSKAINSEERTLTAVISTGETDRDGDILRPKGGRFVEYKKNPVVLWAHESWSLPIAKALAIRVVGDTVEADVKFADTPFANEVFDLYKDGFLNAWSIGFEPIEFEKLRTEPDESGYARVTGYDVKKWNLLEFSSVPVPANTGTGTILPNSVKSATLKSLFEGKEGTANITKSTHQKLVCTDCGADAEYSEEYHNQPCKNCGGPLDLCDVKSQEADAVPANTAREVVFAGKAGYSSDAKFAENAFKKTLSERGDKKIPLVIKCDAGISAISVSLCVDSIQQKENEAGEVVVTEARINEVTVSIPNPAEVVPDEDSEGKSAPEGGTTPEDDLEGHAKPEEGAEPSPASDSDKASREADYLEVSADVARVLAEAEGIA